MKRLCNFVRIKISLILFIIFAITCVTAIIFIGYKYNTNNTMPKNINCEITNSMKSYDELLKENQNLKIQVLKLLEQIEYLQQENNTYKKQTINIHVDNLNPHTKSNLTITEMNSMLVNTGLELQGPAFYDMENTYNVNALFAMGVAMHESANGYKTANTHNYFGFRGNNGWMSFSSAYECIQYFGKLIHYEYSDKQTISAIQHKYCPDGSSWTLNVKTHINQLKRKILI